MPNYSVGYKNPPRHAQFKPGNRANPDGRRGKKGRRTEAEIVNELLNGRVTYKEGGKVKRARRIDVVIKRLGAAALKGDVSAAAMLLKIRAFFEGCPNTEPLGFCLSPQDAVIL